MSSNMMNNQTLLKMERRLSNSTKSMLDKKMVLEFLIVAFIAADAITLYTNFSKVLIQNPVLLWTTTLIIAAIVDTTPTVAAAVIKKKVHARTKAIALTALGLAFFAFIAGTFLLRLSLTSETASVASLQIETELEVEKTSATISKGAIITSVLMGLEPLGTSVILFVMSLLEQDNQIEEAREQKIILEQYLGWLQAQEAELKEELAYDLEGQIRAMKGHMDEMVQIAGRYMDAVSRRVLAEHLGTPEAITHLMEEEEDLHSQFYDEMSTLKEVA